MSENNDTQAKRVGIDNYTGCLLGGAIGDSLGAPIEFLTADEIHKRYGDEGVTDYIEFGNGKGEFTDDTQMTLFTADGVIRSMLRYMVKGIWGAITDQTYYAYLRWLKTQGEVNNTKYKDIYDGWLIKEKSLYQRRCPGNTCLDALINGISGSVEEPLNNSKGSGGVMRMAPVGLVFYNGSKFAFKMGCDLAAITHGHPSGYLSAGFLASMIACLSVQKTLKDSIEESIQTLKQWNGHEECLKAFESAITMAQIKKPNSESIEQLGKGWIAEEALSIAIYCSLSYPSDFRKGVLASINHSGDSDTTGSITGNILGLIVGENNIPKEWIDNLQSSDIVKRIGQDLFNADDTKITNYGYNPEWNTNYPS